MSTANRYDEDFKRTLVELYHNGKTQASLIKEYGVSQTALSRWIKQYSTVETDGGEVLTAKQVKELQKRMAQLEEENQIQKSDCHIRDCKLISVRFEIRSPILTIVDLRFVSADYLAKPATFALHIS